MPACWQYIPYTSVQRQRVPASSSEQELPPANIAKVVVDRSLATQPAPSFSLKQRNLWHSLLGGCGSCHLHTHAVTENGWCMRDKWAHRSMKRAHMTTLDTHDSWQLMCKHDWPMRVVDGSDERTGCEADIATAVTRLSKGTASSQPARFLISPRNWGQIQR